MTSIAQEAQNTIKEYATRWGFKVIKGSFDDKKHSTRVAYEDTGFYCLKQPYRATMSVVDALEEAGIYVAPFSACTKGTQRSAIDVPNRRLYWPANIVNPYLLLHEVAHLLLAVLTEVPPSVQAEDSLFTAIEYWSVEYLTRLRTGVTRRDWVQWRESTSDTDQKMDMYSDAEQFKGPLLETFLFYEDRKGKIAPTFWPI